MKTDKELAVELMGNYLRAVYSQEKMKALDPEGFKKILNACYDAVKSLQLSKRVSHFFQTVGYLTHSR